MSGCVTQSRIKSIKTLEQGRVYQDGRETIISSKNHTVAISLESSIIDSDVANFIVAVKNEAGKDIVFSTENMSAMFYDADSRSKMDLKIFNYEELVYQENEKQKWAKFGAALQGLSESMNAANAGHSYTSGTVFGSAYTNTGTTIHGSGFYSSHTYDQGAAAAAQANANARSQERFDRLNAEGKANLDKLSSNILKKQTISPGNWHGGIVKIQIPQIKNKTNSLAININIANEIHSFAFTQEKIQN